MKFPLFFLLAICASTLYSQEQLTWEEAPQYVVEINTKLDVGTRLYQPENHKPYLLLRSASLKSCLLINLGTKVVSEVPAKDVRNAGEYGVETKGMPAEREIARYAMSGVSSAFGYQGKTFVVKIKPPIIGETTESFIYQHSPLYAILRDKYKPKKAAIDFLKNYAVNTEIVVVFATWCPTCKKVLPRFLRILKDAANNRFSTKFFGLALGGSEPKWIVDKYGTDYPDLIFYQNGKEKGRIFGDPPGALEERIQNLLSH